MAKEILSSLDNKKTFYENAILHNEMGETEHAIFLMDEYLDYFKYADLEFDRVKKGKEFLSKWKSQLDNM